MEGRIAIGADSGDLNLYSRVSKAGKKGFGMTGRITVQGVQYMVNGTISPITPMSAAEKAEKRALAQEIARQWAARKAHKI